jgi:hypothetical protein
VESSYCKLPSKVVYKIDPTKEDLLENTKKKIIGWLDKYLIYSNREDINKVHWIIYGYPNNDSIALFDISSKHQYVMIIRLINGSKYDLDALYSVCYETYYNELKIVPNSQNFRSDNEYKYHKVKTK